MFVPDAETVVVVRQWVQKADNDLKTAVHTLELGEECPTDYDPIPLTEAQEAVAIAQRVRRQMRRFLPQDNL